jgi:hypothetical protein
VSGTRKFRQPLGELTRLLVTFDAQLTGYD